MWDVSADGISDDVNNPTPATSESSVVLWHDPLCISLTQLDLSNWDTTRLNSTVRMFAGNEKLEKIYVGNSDIHYKEGAVSALGIYVTPKVLITLYHIQLIC